MVNLETLESLDIFKGLDDSELGKIQEICTTEEYQINERLFAEGTPATDLWIVTKGNVDLRFEMPDTKPVSEASTISSHGPIAPESQVFGWSCFIPPYKMRLSAFCVSRRCEVIKINRTALTKLMENEPAMGYKIMKYMVQVVGFRSKQFQDLVAKFMGIGLMNSW